LGIIAFRNSATRGTLGIFDNATLTAFIDPPTLTPFTDPATENATLLPPLEPGQPTQTLLPPELLTPEIQAANELVRNNPGDPNAHLQLSLALWDNGQKSASYEALAQAANLAGPTNKDFYVNAAEEFKTRDAWVPAAGMYMRLAAIDRGDGMPSDVKEDLSEAVYKAAGEKDMPLVVFFDRIDAFELPLGHIVRGRYALYQGNADEAKLQLANAQRVKSDLYEAYLLKAEIEMKVGSLATAKTILISLSSDLGAAAWIREMAGELLTTIQ
jgi:tetratricopeptide (TPR) repeat protein